MVIGQRGCAESCQPDQASFQHNEEDPDGKKVGLVNSHQIWAFVADPCNHNWCSKFAIEGSFTVHVRNMIEHYVPLDGDGSIKTCQVVKKDFSASLLSVILCDMLHMCDVI